MLSVIKSAMLNPKTDRRHFGRDLILVFVALAVLVIASIAYFSIQADRHISQEYIQNAALRAVGEFQSMADTISRDLRLVGGWADSGKLTLDDLGGLNGLLFPILERDRLLFGISLADTDGENFYAAETDNGWRTSRTGISDTGRRTVRRYWDANQRLLSEEQEPSRYDPRSRPWFFPAISTDGVFWTLPYSFYDRREVGITASLACRKADDRKQMIVAFDVLLDDLFEEIQRMAPSKNSKVVIFRRDAQIYVPESQDASPDFTSLAQIKEPLIQKVIALWERASEPSTEAFSIRYDNQSWWSGFRPLDSATRNIWVGVMVPESDIVGGINQRRAGLWSVAGVILIAAGGFAFWMIKRYGHPVEGAENQFDPRAPEQSIRHLIAAGEGRTIEFKSTMRMNLHTRKPGKEIEIAWLKAVTAFMNTDGGTLLLGVADDGRITGLEQDEFDNEDKCRLHFKNLINQHIGAELSRHLQFAIVRMEDKQVGVVSCARSSEPAYLKTGKSEAFYIRSGPSSDELPVSKVVAYLRIRD